MYDRGWVEFCVSAASKDMANAERYLVEKSALGWVCDHIKSSFMWAIHAWLLSHNYEPNFGNGWHSMRSQFYEVAPESLRDEISHCLGSVVLHQGPETLFENGEIVYKSPSYISEEWQRTAMKHLIRAKAALELLLNDIAEGK